MSIHTGFIFQWDFPGEKHVPDITVRAVENYSQLSTLSHFHVIEYNSVVSQACFNLYKKKKFIASASL